ncbi:MAG: hypothetical protein H0T53_16240 [Herpetosiphonaceae bacterium]|nr:hypothetical protein [Herpetosiphonaceae bacterium]
MDLIYLTLVTTPAALLLHDTPEGWRLPQFTFATPHFWQDVAPLNQAVAAEFGLDVTTLRCLTIIDDDAAAQARFYYVQAAADLRPLDAGVEWQALADLAGLAWAEPEHARIVAEWQARVQPERLHSAPWYQPAWATTASAWMTRQLAQHGYTLISPPEQLRSWGRSTVWRIVTTAGLVYFKAVPPMFAHEVVLTAGYPAWFAPLIAADLTEHWLLMPAAGEETLADSRDLDQWAAALRQYARLQIALAPQAADLLALGVPDRRLEVLLAGIDALLEPSMLAAAGLAPEEISLLQSRKAALEDSARQLMRHAIPASLEHGDFWPGQIVGQSERFTVIDWSDSSIAHPFFSLRFFLSSDLPDHPAAYAQLCSAYLEPWTQFAPIKQLQQAFALAQELAPLHHALIYHQHILPQLAERWEMAQMLPYFLRLLLEDSRPL